MPVLHAALPLGAFKAPGDGWLVVRDVHGSCADLRAYDLANGAALAATECAGAVTKSRAGRVSVAALREAAWMLALSTVADEEVRVESESFEVPEEVDIALPLALGASGFSSYGCRFGGGVRHWSWMRARGGALSGQVGGQLRLPSRTTSAEEHATELLAIVDDAFDSTCAPSGLPKSVDWTSPGPAVSGRAEADLGGPGPDPAREALRRAAAAPSCAKLP